MNRLTAAGTAGRDVVAELGRWQAELRLTQTTITPEQANALFSQLVELNEDANRSHVQGPALSLRCITSAVTPPFDLNGLYAIGLQHHGSSNFIVWLIEDATGIRVELVSNRIGTVDETRTFRATGRYRFAVEADGEWMITMPLIPN